MSALDLSKPVQTRDGQPVLILTTQGRYPNHPVVGYCGDRTELTTWTKEGQYSFAGPGSANDLINVPEWNLLDHITKYFRPLTDGEKPHREDFTQEMLEGGWRPLLATDKHKIGDQYYRDGSDWTSCDYDCSASAWTYGSFYRTKRPLPPLTKRVPLSAADVPPGSAVRRNPDHDFWAIVNTLGPVGLSANGHFLNWNELMNWQILRPDSTTWEPCSKNEPS